MKNFLFVIFTILVCSFHALVSNYLHAVIVMYITKLARVYCCKCPPGKCRVAADIFFKQDSAAFFSLKIS